MGCVSEVSDDDVVRNVVPIGTLCDILLLKRRVDITGPVPSVALNLALFFSRRIRSELNAMPMMGEFYLLGLSAHKSPRIMG